ncbi:6-phospho-beta-glucosidase [Lacisediminihabitans changchengi]|uniref:6-phospho-beta-glucosidase n=1 Tax=Lacisediminihabitans changchengi TaxID=2787634 RepID=A0A934SJZ3_9MICO|nr:6-phospho-beta-glucosidase [Lacisediminihabitans changchengi]MBK4346302.1 6-phospho-beta-glucosidase [Lacisediminihabitans changchengi]
MKLAILGGGGFRVPLVFQALVEGEHLVDDVWLYDVSESRLAVITAVLTQMTPQGSRIRVHSTTSLDEAIEGSDFVFSAVRVGGLEARVADERAALSLGVLGQETTGPGGIAYALRTIPVAMRVADVVARLAPLAYVINFTNPAGMITEAMQSILGNRVIGICDTPSGLGRRIASMFGLPTDRLELDYVGLNHLGWLRGVRYLGNEILPDLFADDDKLGRLDETGLFGAEWLRSLGMIPNEYLHYYYNNRDAVAAISKGRTRGEYLHEQQHRFYERVAYDPSIALALWHSTKADREATYMENERDPSAAPHDLVGGGYEKVALDVMRAIAHDQRTTMILNVRNGSTLAGLPASAVVEVPSLVDASGAHPLSTDEPGGSELGLMQQMKSVERLTIASVVSSDRSLAVKALGLHPLVGSVSTARQLLAAYEANTTSLFAVAGTH